MKKQKSKQMQKQNFNLKDIFPIVCYNCNNARLEIIGFIKESLMTKCLLCGAINLISNNIKIGENPVSRFDDERIKALMGIG